jgi:hypothetical protein
MTKLLYFAVVELGQVGASSQRPGMDKEAQALPFLRMRLWLLPTEGVTCYTDPLEWKIEFEFVHRWSFWFGYLYP